MKIKILLIIPLLFMIATVTMAQKRPVTGTVIDSASKETLASVNIRLKGTNLMTATDAYGKFTINASPQDELIISYTGYKTATITVGDNSIINVSLASSIASLNEVVAIGTRTAGRAKLETAVPVDVVNITKAANSTGRMDITDILNYAAPSFNYNKQSGSDGADHVELGTLRGLGPDQTLVLVNGKRRHSTAFVSVFGTRGRGNSGVDLSAIPTAALDRLEILRDGASAQYGSDAIAGVINLVLKKSVKQLTINAGYSGFYDPAFNSGKSVLSGYYPHGGTIDGNTFNMDANYGLPIGLKGGFINLTLDYSKNGKTFRQTKDTTMANPKALPFNPYRRANGDGSAETGTLFFNNEIPLSDKTTFYSFGGYSRKSSEAYAFTRNFSGSPGRFPTKGDDLIPVSGIIFNDPAGDSYFNPFIQTKIDDAALALGLKGTFGTDWTWDLSNNAGNNKFHFYGDKTFNASLGATKTNFDDGGSEFFQNTTNLNLSKHFPKALAGMNLGLGAEFRYERYKIFAGEEASYKNYSDGSKAAGSQGFPGFQPGDAVSANRKVAGVYADLEADITNKWLIDFANRLEHYSDFGYNFNTKFATRYKITSNFNLRGALGTGFRAPSLQQINYSSTFTNVEGTVISEVKIAPNYSAITKAAGIANLKQEKSKNAGLGFTYQPIPELSVTIDGYIIKVTDRVVLSGQFSADDPTLDPVFTSALKKLNVGSAQFFANAVNTTNRGIDVVLDYSRTVGNNRYRLLFTGNFQKMTIDKVNYPPILGSTPELQETFLSAREKKFILASAPRAKFSVNPEYGHKTVTVGARFTYFGKVDLLGYGSGEYVNGLPAVPTDVGNGLVPDQYIYSGKMVSDVYLGIKLSKVSRLSLGVDNVFNVHPDLAYAKGAKGYAFNNEPAGPFDAVQMGQNGRRLFARIGFIF